MCLSYFAVLIKQREQETASEIFGKYSSKISKKQEREVKKQKQDSNITAHVQHSNLRAADRQDKSEVKHSQEEAGGKKKKDRTIIFCLFK